MAYEKLRLTSELLWNKGTIDDYINDVGIVWKDQDRPRTMIDIWLRVVQHSSELGELVRRSQFDKAKDQLGHISIWMLTFAAKGQIQRTGLDNLFQIRFPLSQILWRKFPNCCPTCFTRRVALALAKPPESWDGEVKECDCILTLAETENRNKFLTPEQKKEAKEKRLEYAKKMLTSKKVDYDKISLIELEDRFSTIFKRNIFALDLEQVTFHFLEEVGEVVEALTALYTFKGENGGKPEEELRPEWQKRLADLEEELADSFSWLFAVSSKFRDVFSIFDAYTKVSTHAKEMFVASHLIKRHRRESDSLMKCYVCGSSPCNCQIRLIIGDDSANKLTGVKAKSK